jgi:transcriptional regulator with XRE-family HTH domain
MIGKRLHRLRIGLLMTQAELAWILGISVRSMGRWESPTESAGEPEGVRMAVLLVLEEGLANDHHFGMKVAYWAKKGLPCLLGHLFKAKAIDVSG